MSRLFQPPVPSFQPSAPYRNGIASGIASTRAILTAKGPSLSHRAPISGVLDHHRARVEIRLERLGAALGAVARVLDAAEWHLCRGQRGHVHPEHAYFQAAREQVGVLERPGEGVAGEADGQAVR